MNNEHAKLIENYQNVSLQVKYLQEIIKNLEEKIHELENEKEAKKSKCTKSVNSLTLASAKIVRIVVSSIL